MFDISSYFPITDSTWIFFIVLAIILFAPMIMSKLRIPHIIGMVLAGVVVGPYGLNILQRDGSFELFGQVGLYYIMFLAGLPPFCSAASCHQTHSSPTPSSANTVYNDTRRYPLAWVPV